jgi:hypothetical protein
MGSHPKWDTGAAVTLHSSCPETGVTPWWDTGATIRSMPNDAVSEIAG